MLASFADWRTKEATVKQLVQTVGPTGIPEESETTVTGPVAINYWTDQSVVTNQNDKFVGQNTGRALFPPTVSLDTTMWFEVDAVKHYITGVDDVGGFGEVVVVSWRRENGT